MTVTGDPMQDDFRRENIQAALEPVGIFFQGQALKFPGQVFLFQICVPEDMEKMELYRDC